MTYVLWFDVTLFFDYIDRREALLKWKQKLGHDATYGKLVSAFTEAGHKDYADNIYEIIGKLLQPQIIVHVY